MRLGDQGGQFMTQREGPASLLPSSGAGNNPLGDTRGPSINDTNFLAIQLDELTIESIRLGAQAAITTETPVDSLSTAIPEVTAQRMDPAQTDRDRDQDQTQVPVDDLDSGRATRSTPSALLLAQPLSLALDEDQPQSHFLSSDPTLTPLRRLRASTPLSLEHTQNYLDFANDHPPYQEQSDYTNSNTMEYASNINTTNNSINSINNTNNNTNTIQTNIDIEQENRINGYISEPTRSYQSSIFTSMEPQETYPSDTRLALSQVLTSFQGAIIDQAFDRFTPQTTDPTTSMNSNNTPATGSVPTFTDGTRSATAPVHLLASSEVPSLADDSLSLSTENLTAFPRAALPRRRYATRDYSTGSISSDDWLHHPDVVAFNIQDSTQVTSDAAETPFVRTELRQHPSFVIQADQGETPMQRDQVAESALDRAAESIAADSLSSAAAEAIISSTLADPPNVVQESHSIAPPAAIDNDGQITQPLDIPLGPLRSDRLDLLGPLLSGTHNAPLPPPSDEALGFSLLGSSSRRVQGFDSSILSMVSRIRQARLARVLRLMGERDHWGRFAPADTRSMVNHASISRGTSRAGSSVEENQADQYLESDSRDITEDGRATMRQRDATSSSLVHPTHYPAFTEILDCNGNPLDSSNESYASSSSASSMTSYDALDDRDEDMDWLSGTERRLRRRTGLEDQGWNRGVVRGQGRSRVVSTGTAFEGLEYISQTDNLLNENGRYRSLKASWMTNPNGESWSDDEGDDPQQRQQEQDHEDKDSESIPMRRDPLSLGMLPPHNDGGQGGGLYYIYGNVRNRYGPDSVRRRRVMSDMTMLLRREQEWERELEQYDREMAEFQLGGFFNNNSGGQGTRNDRSVPRISMIASTPDGAATTLGASVANASAGGRRASSNGGSISGTGAVSSGSVGDGSGGSAPNLTRSNDSFGSTWSRSGTALTAESSIRPTQEFRDYQQGHSHYHAQNEMVSEQQGRQGSNGQGRDHPLLEHHRQHLLEQNQQQQQQRQRQQLSGQSMTHQSALMNRTPPLLPAQPLLNEPIAHQIRRAHNSHIMGLHRRWEIQQQQQQQQLEQLRQLQQLQQLQQQQQQLQHYEQVYSNRSLNGDREQDRFQRYSNMTFVPPPSRQQPQNHPNQSHISTSSTGSGLHVAVPMSRGSRSSFRTSHETNGFQHFNLTGNGTTQTQSFQHPYTAPPPSSGTVSSASSGSALTTFPLLSFSATSSAISTSTAADSNMFSSSSEGRFTRRFGVSSGSNQTEPLINLTELPGSTGPTTVLPSGVMLPAASDMQSGIGNLGVTEPTSTTSLSTLHATSTSSSSSSSSA
ncbi:hypothetical protein BGX24_003355, partial [Mortierella sp. AD032]